MEVQYNRTKDEIYIKEKIDNQTMYMAFQEEEYSTDMVFINVYLTLYNKRKQINRNESQAVITGKNPVKTYVTAKKAFNLLEQHCVLHYTPRQKVIISLTWLDTRRRDAYYKVLSKKGYYYGVGPDGYKCIMKVFHSEEDIV